MGFGTAPIGNQFRAVPEDDAARGLQPAPGMPGSAISTPRRCTATGSPSTASARRSAASPRDEYVLSTKVGRLLEAGAASGEISSPFWVNMPPFEIVHDYSYDAVMRSFEDSLQRMGQSRFDILFIHDIDVWTHGAGLQAQHFRTAMDSGYKALEKLRSERLVTAIGVGCNEWQVCEAALRERDFDCFLLAGRYTLLEQDALDTFLPLCEERGVADRARRRLQQRHPRARRRRRARTTTTPRPRRTSSSASARSRRCARNTACR